MRENLEIVEQMYARWQKNRAEVSADWNNFFEGFALGLEESRDVGVVAASAEGGNCEPQAQLQSRATGAIFMYRTLGHTQANINPLLPPEKNPRLTLERLGFRKEHLGVSCDVGNYKAGKSRMSVGELLWHLEETYCGTLGVEYVHVQASEKRRFLQERMETSQNRPVFAAEKKKRILRQVLEAELFENFLHTRFVGQKRFSLEGGETMMAALEALMEKAPACGIKSFVLGMAHRGRLDVLTQLMGKSYKYLFREFDVNYEPNTVWGGGDVKYHLGYSSTVERQGQKIDLHLTPNPSHLEAVDPVTQGRARALQRRLDDMKERKAVIPVLIHGDAAFIGQGIVAETFNLSKLTGYTTGGTIHFVINNQIGFTTDPDESRSSRYCSDMAKMIESPIFHVNGDDPEAVVYAMELALDYRQAFHDDVVIDMLCYRRHGHNEGDEPRFTQPKLYAQIDKHPLISATYGARLQAEGALAPGELDGWKSAKLRELESGYEAARAKATLIPFVAPKHNPFVGTTHPEPQDKWNFDAVLTSVHSQRLEAIAKVLTTIPEGFVANQKIERLARQKADAIKGDRIDWATAEALAWGSLLLEGTPVRLSGQDCVRGTFSHRHAAWFDTRDDRRYEPLNNLGSAQAQFCIHNSSLSEAAVLGFDYGYSLDYPEMLCQWEAQFGDFANGAQTIIDQFIAASEHKWQIHSGLTLLLPHGYEGQGPEHSSARLERFLQMCARENIQVASPSTPAQYFHLLRRQMKRTFLKPLVVMTPKSLLRLDACVSARVDLSQGAFEEILDDAVAKKAERVIVCSGKIFYELAEYRRERKAENVALVRVEQLYPFHAELWRQLAKKYAGARWVWAQEEPRNMGAWSFVRELLEEGTGIPFLYAGRPASPSPAEGSLALHKKAQAKLIEEAFRI